MAPVSRACVNGPVSESVDSLVLDLLAWIGAEPRTYPEVMEAWRTSCPQLPVWEEANERGFISRRRGPRRGAIITLSAAGAQHLRAHRGLSVVAG
jgi:hypothetical protein